MVQVLHSFVKREIEARSFGLGSFLVPVWPKLLWKCAVEPLRSQNDSWGWVTFGFEDSISDDLVLAAALAGAECFLPVALAAAAVTALKECAVRLAADLCVRVAQCCVNLTDLSGDSLCLAMEYLICYLIYKQLANSELRCCRCSDSP